MMFQRPVRSQHQPFLKNLKLHFDRFCVVKKTEQLAGSSFSPEIVQSDAEIVQVPKGKSKKREGASKLEMNA